LRALLGDTALDVDQDRVDAAEPKVLDPAIAEFLGTDLVVGPIMFDEPTPATPLFAGSQPGPLTDLAPELSRAIAIIAGRLK
jgi:hypothetical protein